VQANAAGTDEGNLGDEKCEPGSVDEAVNDEEKLGCGVRGCPVWEPVAEEEGAGKAEENRSGNERGKGEIKTMLRSPRANADCHFESLHPGICRRGHVGVAPSTVGGQSAAIRLAV